MKTIESKHDTSVCRTCRGEGVVKTKLSDGQERVRHCPHCRGTGKSDGGLQRK